MSEFQNLLQEELKTLNLKRNGMTCSRKWMLFVP